jgi:hypothetical protein
MNSNNTDQQDAIQLLSHNESRALITAFVEGAGRILNEEEFEAATGIVFDWAKRVRCESEALESVLCGKLLVRCGSDGEIEFKAKDSEHCEPSE